MSTTSPSTGVFPTLHTELVRDQARDEVPAWLETLRDGALRSFEACGLPSAHDEQWRQTSVVAIGSTSFRPGAAQDVTPAQLAPFRLGGCEAVFINGHFAPSLSSVTPLPGIEVGSLAPRLTRADGLAGRLAQIASPEKSPFTALNTAFLEDGACVLIGAGVAHEEPIHLLFFSTNPDPDRVTVTHPRTLIAAGRGSQVRIVETYAGGGGERYFTNAVTEIELADGAVVEHYKRQQEGLAAFHIGRIAATQGPASKLTSFSLSLGGGLARTDIDARLAGEGADCGMYGLFLGREHQHVDHHTLIDHATPHGTSREVYKGILDGHARGVFFGTIVVRPGAVKTSAHQTNKNLLLSRDALVSSTPRLQIENDDVRCKHGSTTGQLDAAALFYMRSRGIGEAEARRILTYAFAADIIERISVPSLRRALVSSLDAYLPGAGSILEVAS